MYTCAWETANENTCLTSVRHNKNPVLVSPVSHACSYSRAFSCSDTPHFPCPVIYCLNFLLGSLISRCVTPRRSRFCCERRHRDAAVQYITQKPWAPFSSSPTAFTLILACVSCPRT